MKNFFCPFRFCQYWVRGGRFPGFPPSVQFSRRCKEGVNRTKKLSLSSSSSLFKPIAKTSGFLIQGVKTNRHGDPAADQIVREPSGGCRGDLISTPDSGYYRVFYKSFLWGNLSFGGCFEKPSLQALFWCKKLRSRKKIGKVTKRRRSAKPTCANGGTNASFCTSGDFQFFLARGQVCFEFDSATVKREKKKERRKKRLWPKAKRKDFFNFSQSFVFGEGNRRLFTPGAKNFSCSRRRCSCVVRFACARLKGQLGFERLSKSCTLSGAGKMALSFNSSFA